jgi:hypothetical protein
MYIGDIIAIYAQMKEIIDLKLDFCKQDRTVFDQLIDFYIVAIVLSVNN